MSLSAFITPPSFNHFSKPLLHFTQRRCHHHRFHKSFPHHSITNSINRHAEIQVLEQRLRSLDASSAADLAYVTFTSNSLPPTWQQLLHVLANNGIKGRVLSRLAARLGIHALLSLTPENIPQVLQYLSTTLSLTELQRNRVVMQRPDLLRASLSTLKASTDALLVHLNTRDLKHITLRWPGILLLPPNSIARVTAFLSSRPCLLSSDNTRCLLRRAPWILVYDIDRDMAPVIYWLNDELRSNAPDPLAKYLLASPQLLGTSRSNLHQVMRFLREDVRMNLSNTVAVIRQFPPILTCSPETILNPTLHFLRRNVGLEQWQVLKVVRAFPAILTLHVDTDMKPVVDYFRKQGISNVPRLVTRLPPVLGYDLHRDIIPKVQFVENVLGLSVYDILRFPAYFSHDLRKRIEPRTRFLQQTGKSVARIGLNTALSLTDKAFCERIGASLHDYSAFKKTIHQQHKRVRASSNDESGFERSDGRHPNVLQQNDLATSDSSKCSADDSYVWNGTMDTSKRRKKRFRATLTRMPWAQMGERS